MVKMKNKYLRLKLVAKRTQKAKELARKEKAERTLKHLTQELENVILKSRQRKEWIKWNLQIGLFL